MTRKQSVPTLAIVFLLTLLAVPCHSQRYFAQFKPSKHNLDHHSEPDTTRVLILLAPKYHRDVSVLFGSGAIHLSLIFLFRSPPPVTATTLQSATTRSGIQVPQGTPTVPRCPKTANSCVRVAIQTGRTSTSGISTAMAWR